MYIQDFLPGIYVKGISPEGRVLILNAQPFGTTACEITYKKLDGSVDQQLMYEGDALSCSVVEADEILAFSADASDFILVSEATRIGLAYLFDPYLAVHTSAIEPLPHQITAVYEEMLNKHPLRYILADDPGAGKTIMTGMLLKELMIRGDVLRCMIVCPGNLAEQWQDELYQKFNLHFEILTNDMLESAATGNAFTEHNRIIARLDKLSRDEFVQKKIEASEWDLIVVDEAHKLSASVTGQKIKYTKRYHLGELLSRRTRHFLLLTATPHNGKEAEFRQFMRLIDSDRFQFHPKSNMGTIDISDVMRRLVKEELLKFDGTPLFPERISVTVNYSLSPLEQNLYESVTAYVRDQFNRADRLAGDKRQAVGFALTILQRRLASSPEAIYQSIRRRRERLMTRASELQDNYNSYGLFLTMDQLEDLEDAPGDEYESFEEEMLDEATAAATLQEMEEEIAILTGLEEEAFALRASKTDHKWDQVSKLLQETSCMFNEHGKREKVIIFTEHKDTLNYLVSRIESLLGNPDAVVSIKGGMPREQRRHIEAQFKQDKDTLVLVATDAAGEGINLQRAHLMINYDLPWNPNRLEQRFGRIHRIGQTEVCYLWNIVAKGTREGQVFERLFQKLEQEKLALGGQVYDILGKVMFDDKPLRELLVEAIRYGNDPKVRARLNTVVDQALDKDYLLGLLEQRALSKDVMDVSSILRIKEEMERMNARRLQPFYIKKFFMDAFKAFGGTLYPREVERFEITRVPAVVRQESEKYDRDKQVLSKYERICFAKNQINVEGKPVADLICPGHTLLDTLTNLVKERYNSVLSQGTVFIDPNDSTDEPRILCYLDTAVQDNVLVQGRRRVVSRQLQFVELTENGNPRNAGYAPYIDYDPVDEEFRPQVTELIQQKPWLNQDIEQLARMHAITSIIPQQYEEVRALRIAQVEKIQSEIKKRLTAEIQFWDGRAAILREKLKKAPSPMGELNAQQAQQRADGLAQRMKIRLEELEKEKQLSSAPPLLLAKAIVIPRKLLIGPDEVLSNEPIFGIDKRAIELTAMKAVIDVERNLGYDPVDVSKQNCGYDIMSKIPKEFQKGNHTIRCIEVKGRSADHAGTVTISRNEIMTALNIPDQYILALVAVEGEKTIVTYCTKMFTKEPEWATASWNMVTNRLLKQSTIVYDERIEE